MKSTLALTTTLIALCSAHSTWAATTTHTRIFTGSGTLTVPANVTTSTEYQFIVIGGGGGAGGCHEGTTSGGGSGGAGFVSFSGFNPSDTITITIGTGGAGGNNSASNGGNGVTSKVTYAGIDIAASTGGGGSLGSTALASAAGSAGNFSATAGSTTLALHSMLNYAAEDGLTAFLPITLSQVFFAIPGGGNPIGHSGTFTNHNGALGGGGLGCFDTTATGGAGGGGVVIISWTA